QARLIGAHHLRSNVVTAIGWGQIRPLKTVVCDGRVRIVVSIRGIRMKRDKPSASGERLAVGQLPDAIIYVNRKSGSPIHVVKGVSTRSSGAERHAVAV